MFTSPLNQLRQSTWLAGIPDTLTVPEIGVRPTRAISVERATVDDVALALVAINARQAALCRLSTSLKEVHDLARKEGALGADNAVIAAARQIGEAQ